MSEDDLQQLLNHVRSVIGKLERGEYTDNGGVMFGPYIIRIEKTGA